jgi:hypothetical protein
MAGKVPAEHARLAAADAGSADWRKFGPYLAERAWGTVREDYSADGDAWAAFPFDEARSRAFRWNEDGLGGICDSSQELCFAFTFWNGVDPILKERLFGLSGHEGNHGEDVKEQWWYVDATPTSSWLRWRYHYPIRPFPYSELRAENAARSRSEPEFELEDTDAFADGGWEITVDYAKASPTDIAIRLRAHNTGAERATLVIAPTLWFRNTWAWGLDDRQPVIRADGDRVVAQGVNGKTMTLVGSGTPEVLVCDNDTDVAGLWGGASRTAYPKNAIGDRIVGGSGAVNASGVGTKAALVYRLVVDAGESAELRLRLADSSVTGDLAAGFTRLMSQRRREADEFYAGLLDGIPEDRATVARQAFAGLLWSRQFYHYDVDRWLDGDPSGPRPPDSRLRARNSGWRHLNNHDVISMPDCWEYPWYAAWDLAFHTVALAHVDPTFAKEQLILFCREWYMHPNGALPAYEWEFGEANPPVHAWAALRVFVTTGGTDWEFLERIFHKLLINFTWWVNREDSQGDNVFEGGFLGLDNIGAFDRSAPPPVPGRLEQSDGTAWMALYCLSMLEMALCLAAHDSAYDDVATKFFEHFTYIATAMTRQGLWDDSDGFFYDVFHPVDGPVMPITVRSVVGLIPVLPVLRLDPDRVAGRADFAGRLRWFLTNKPEFAEACVLDPSGAGGALLTTCPPDRLARILSRICDEDEFLSPHGVRSLSRVHATAPFALDLGGHEISVDYEPAESATGLFGGNSNWRGPVWFPINVLLIDALRRHAAAHGPGLTVEFPTGSGERRDVDGVADALADRLISLFVPGDDGGIAAAGARRWPPGLLWFHEYFHGDTGAGLGASHQTGWTALVADLIIDRARRS